MLLIGEEIIVGFRYREVPGSNYTQRFHYLNALSASQAMDLAGKIGFACRLHSQGELLMIPAGYLVISVTTCAKEVSTTLPTRMTPNNHEMADLTYYPNLAKKDSQGNKSEQTKAPAEI